ncbi:MAG: sugar phosphate isomerase/epimerase [Acidobacteriota bacterium]
MVILKNKMSRREMLTTAALSAGALSLAGAEISVDAAEARQRIAGDGWAGFKAGVASYTLRKMPLDDAIKAIKRVGLSYVSIKDAHLSLKSSTEERKEVAAKFKAAGITPMSCGNVGMENDEAQIRNAFEYARDLGLPTIVCSPDPRALPILDRMVKEFDIKIAIHNHGPEDKKFPSPYDVWTAVQPYDKRVGLCIDVGHTARALVDPAEAIVKCRARLYDLHFKDIASTDPKAGTVEAGRGVLDLKSILQALQRVKYPYLLSFEYEKDSDDPLPGLSESIGYTRGLLAAMPGSAQRALRKA